MNIVECLHKGMEQKFNHGQTFEQVEWDQNFEDQPQVRLSLVWMLSADLAARSRVPMGNGASIAIEDTGH